jgi:hypothetical protein
MRGRPFKKGQSGNEGGRPKVAGHIRELAREHTAEALCTLVTVMQNAKSPPAARVTAATALLDRGYGRPGPGPVQFTLPHPLESAGDAAAGMAEIMKAIASGAVTPTEGVELGRLVEIYVKTLEASELERRIQVLEAVKARTNEK